jgi:hypothetical protein
LHVLGDVVQTDAHVLHRRIAILVHKRGGKLGSVLVG